MKIPALGAERIFLQTEWDVPEWYDLKVEDIRNVVKIKSAAAVQPNIFFMVLTLIIVLPCIFLVKLHTKVHLKKRWGTDTVNNFSYGCLEVRVKISNSKILEWLIFRILKLTNVQM